MSNIELSVAKTGQQTCTINGIRLHSAYDPIKEAQRFVSSLDISFTPSIIVVTEPALSYCATFLRQSYPHAILVAIRFTHDFDAYNHLWDKVLYHQELMQLLQSYGEDMILATAFFPGNPPSRFFRKNTITVGNKLEVLCKQAEIFWEHEPILASDGLKILFPFAIDYKIPVQ